MEYWCFDFSNGRLYVGRVNVTRFTPKYAFLEKSEIWTGHVNRVDIERVHHDKNGAIEAARKQASAWIETKKKEIIKLEQLLDTGALAPGNIGWEYYR